MKSQNKRSTRSTRTRQRQINTERAKSKEDTQLSPEKKGKDLLDDLIKGYSEKKSQQRESLGINEETKSRQEREESTAQKKDVVPKKSSLRTKPKKGAHPSKQCRDPKWLDLPPPNRASNTPLTKKPKQQKLALVPVRAQQHQPKPEESKQILAIRDVDQRSIDYSQEVFSQYLLFKQYMHLDPKTQKASHRSMGLTLFANRLNFYTFQDLLISIMTPAQKEQWARILNIQLKNAIEGLHSFLAEDGDSDINLLQKNMTQYMGSRFDVLDGLVFTEIDLAEKESKQLIQALKDYEQEESGCAKLQFDQANQILSRTKIGIFLTENFVKLSSKTPSRTRWTLKPRCLNLLKPLLNKILTGEIFEQLVKLYEQLHSLEHAIFSSLCSEDPDLAPLYETQDAILEQLQGLQQSHQDSKKKSYTRRKFANPSSDDKSPKSKNKSEDKKISDADKENKPQNKSSAQKIDKMKFFTAPKQSVEENKEEQKPKNLIQTTVCEREPGNVSKLVQKFQEIKQQETNNMKSMYQTRNQAQNRGEGCGIFDTRLKNIDIGESGISFNKLNLPYYKKHLSDLASSQTQLILPSARKPFEPLCSIIQYDLDSEQEWADAHGENINDDLASSADDYNDEEDQDLVDDGFIVDDDYYEETSFDDDLDSGSRNMALIFKRQNKKRLDEQRRIMVSQSNEVRIIYTSECPQNYEAVIWIEQGQSVDDTAEENKIEHVPISEQNIFEIAKLVQASRESKKECLKKIQEQMPNLFKSHLDKFLKEHVSKMKMTNVDMSQSRKKSTTSTKNKIRRSMSSMGQDLDSQSNYRLKLKSESIHESYIENIQRASTTISKEELTERLEQIYNENQLKDSKQIPIMDTIPNTIPQTQEDEININDTLIKSPDPFKNAIKNLNPPTVEQISKAEHNNNPFIDIAPLELTNADLSSVNNPFGAVPSQIAEKSSRLLDQSEVKQAIDIATHDGPIQVNLRDEKLQSLYSRQAQQDKSTPIQDFKSLNSKRVIDSKNARRITNYDIIKDEYN